jgi:ubiquinone/menaquinone biosynthesis C-methylase UbiE
MSEEHLLRYTRRYEDINRIFLGSSEKNIYGLDIDLSSIVQSLKDNNYVTLKQRQAENFPFEDNLFNVIYSSLSIKSKSDKIISYSCKK